MANSTEEQARASWASCLSEVEKSIEKADYEKWFKPLRAVAFDGSMLTIAAPTPGFVDTLEKKFLPQLNLAVQRALGSAVRLRYSISFGGGEMKMPATQQARVSLPGGFESHPPVVDPYIGVMLKGQVADPQLNKDYTFESYIEGENNRLATSVGKKVAESPAGTFNPLFIYGGPGVGKTHLIQAIGARTKELHNDMVVVYLSADRFMRQYTEACSPRGNNINGFLQFYQQDVSMLILDDIQLLIGKDKTADIFFQIFNHLMLNGKQVVLTSDKKPSELVGFPDRLLSRFRQGLVAEIGEPDYAMRIGIVKGIAESEGIDIPDDVVQYVATNVVGNARELRGALTGLLAHATVYKTEVTLQLAQKVVSNQNGAPMSVAITRDIVVKAVCDYFKVETSSMQEDTRKREVVLARQIAMYLCKKLTNDSLSVIGANLGNRRHTTVVYACKAIEGLIETDKKVAEAVERIEASLK